MSSINYGLAPQGVFNTIQGEGHLSGARMTFIRFAGCSVGCPQCDTDYTLGERVECGELIHRVNEASPSGWRDKWVWLTGGEPLDRNLRPLLRALRSEGYSIALATSGTRRAIDPVDWLSVSPHSDATWVQRFGDECKVVPGLNGANLSDFDFARSDFLYYYVQPLSVGGVVVNREECLRWLSMDPNWLITEQCHKTWGVE